MKTTAILVGAVPGLTIFLAGLIFLALFLVGMDWEMLDCGPESPKEKVVSTNDRI